MSDPIIPVNNASAPPTNLLPPGDPMENGAPPPPPPGPGDMPPPPPDGDGRVGAPPPPGSDGVGAGNRSGNRKPVNVMQGGTGDDRLVGKKGNNHLLGGDGNDILIGGNGKDLLVGGKGNDILFGMKGSKVMRGGEGSDIFVLGRGRGMNVVKDFHADEGDKLALPKGLSFDKLSFTQVGQNTMIRQGDRKIALLIGVKSSSVGIDDFVSKPPSTQSPLTPPSTLTPPPSPPV